MKIKPTGNTEVTFDLTFQICGKSKRDQHLWNTPIGSSSNFSEEMIEYLVFRGYDDWKISTIPACLALPIFVAIYECRQAPPTGWKKEAYLLIGQFQLSSCNNN